MGFFENLILQRVYFFIGEIEATLEEYLDTPVLDYFDVDECATFEELFLKIKLNNGCMLTVKEEYTFEHHRLTIQYNYTLLSPDDKPIISYDNSPHHPRLESFPHHKHFYPKSKYEPMSYNGDFVQALQEILWIMENR